MHQGQGLGTRGLKIIKRRCLILHLATIAYHANIELTFVVIKGLFILQAFLISTSVVLTQPGTGRCTSQKARS